MRYYRVPYGAQLDRFGSAAAVPFTRDHHGSLVEKTAALYHTQPQVTCKNVHVDN